MRPFVRRAFAAIVLATALPFAAIAQGKLTTPKQFFGHEIGEDYWLPNYTQFAKYWETLAKESDRMVLDTIGLTAEGRPQLMAIVSSPDNLKNREKYRQIAERLSHAEGLTDAQAKSLAKEGKSIVWIDGGLHATEVLGANQLIETSWQFLSQTDEETLRILNDVIIVFVQANPDGMELVANWYMRESDPKLRNMNIPRLYQKYIGHDNNRDQYAMNQPETFNMNRAMYQEWFPQIMYNHHQTGPAGTVLFVPPFRDPMNYNLHSLIMTGLDQVGSAMHARFVSENKPGATMRTSTLYSTWWNGGLRTTAYYHNIIGLLTETIGNPTPMRIPFIPDKLLRNADLPLPILPQEWHFRQSIDYSVTANRAVLDFTQRYRETMLYRNWQMGADMIAAGSTDSWTLWPKRLQAIKDAIAAASPRTAASPAAGGRGGFGAPPADPKFLGMLRDPSLRDPRGYILPSDQADFPTALKFIEKLQKNAIIVHRATAAFTVAGKSYPAGSMVVKTAQAYRPHVIDMFEPQDHPNDFRFPGAPPTPPYDNAGWTLALQMGVHFDRVLDAFDCPCDRIEPSKLVTAPAGVVAKGGSWKLSPVQNDAFAAVARLQKAGVDVYRAFDGNFYVANNGKSRPVAERAARELGVSFAEGKRPTGAQKLTAPRIALFDRYGGQMPSGHTRWLLEQFGIPSTDIFPQELDAGNLRAKYDVIIFPDGSIPAAGGRGGRGGGGGAGPDTASLPAEYRKTTGNVTVDKTVPQIKAFMEAGGRVVTIGSSTSLAQTLGLPVESYLTEDGKALPAEKFYVPGSLLKASFDTTSTVTKGMDATANVFYDNSPVFKLGPDAAAKGVKRIAWYDKAPLVSGWAWGEKYLEGGTAIAQAAVGSGTLYLFGPEIVFRAQPHGTFRLLFNTFYDVKPPIQ
jgi:hypothetical protein